MAWTWRAKRRKSHSHCIAARPPPPLEEGGDHENDIEDAIALNNVGCEDAIVLNASLNWESEEEEVTTMVDCFDIHILVMLMRECLAKVWRGRR